MHLLTAVPDVLPLVFSFVDQAPKDEDVKAGWTAFAIFIGLCLAVALLGFSLVKQLRKAQAAEDAGLYGHNDKKKNGGAADNAEGSSGPTQA